MEDALRRGEKPQEVKDNRKNETLGSDDDDDDASDNEGDDDNTFQLLSTYDSRHHSLFPSLRKLRRKLAIAMSHNGYAGVRTDDYEHRRSSRRCSEAVSRGRISL